MKQYDKEVKAGAFPAEAHTCKLFYEFSIAFYTIIQHIVIHQYLSVCIFACSNTADLSVGIDGMKQYDKEVKAGAFPAEAHTYKKKVLDEVNKNDTSN
jgi:ketopantoate hydroxymethyltransferase